MGLIRVDLQALIAGQPGDGELCEIAGLGPVPVSAIRDLLGDSILKLVITNGVDVANITHLGRGPNAAQKIALLWTNHTCNVTGCNSTRLQADHRLDYQYTKHTRLDELDGYCKHHHDLKTYKGWALTIGTGKRPMVPPEDPEHPGHPKQLAFDKYPHKNPDKNPENAPGPDAPTAANTANTANTAIEAMRRRGIQLDADGHPTNIPHAMRGLPGWDQPIPQHLADRLNAINRRRYPRE